MCRPDPILLKTKKGWKNDLVYFHQKLFRNPVYFGIKKCFSYFIGK